MMTDTDWIKNKSRELSDYYNVNHHLKLREMSIRQFGGFPTELRKMLIHTWHNSLYRHFEPEVAPYNQSTAINWLECAILKLRAGNYTVVTEEGVVAMWDDIGRKFRFYAVEQTQWGLIPVTALHENMTGKSGSDVPYWKRLKIDARKKKQMAWKQSMEQKYGDQR